MITFWIVTAILIVLAIVLTAPALLRQHKLVELDRNQQNVNIARERLDELTSEHASGAMSDEEFEQTKTELEASLLEDLSDSDAESASISQSARSGRLVLVFLVIFIPSMTLLFYQLLGSPQYLGLSGALAGQQPAGNDMEGIKSIDELAERLKQRLEKSPNDAKGWYLLAKTYMTEKKYPEAVEALQKTLKLLGDHPAVLLGLADAMAMTKGGDLTGKPTEYIERALKLSPDDSTALWLGGMSAQQNGSFQLAVDRWIKLLPQLADNPKSTGEVKSLIEEAVRQAKDAGISLTYTMPEIAAPVSKAIRVHVSLDPALADQAKPDDRVFVFAKASKGPPMPLAAFKTTVSALPLDVTLDDSQAMMPQMKLSAFNEVVVSARVSLSGQPRAQAGDLSSVVYKVDLQKTAQPVFDLPINAKIDDPKAIPVVMLENSQQASTDMPKADTQTSPTPVAAKGKTIKAWVSLDAAIRDKVSDDDVVFVFAKAKSGPPMPLAAFKTKVSALPMEVTLDDSMAMMPQMKLSGFDAVVVSARVSKSGAPIARPGDFSSEAKTVVFDPDQAIVGIELAISSVIE